MYPVQDLCPLWTALLLHPATMMLWTLPSENVLVMLQSKLRLRMDSLNLASTEDVAKRQREAKRTKRNIFSEDFFSFLLC